MREKTRVVRLAPIRHEVTDVKASGTPAGTPSSAPALLAPIQASAPTPFPSPAVPPAASGDDKMPEISELKIEITPVVFTPADLGVNVSSSFPGAGAAAAPPASSSHRNIVDQLSPRRHFPNKSLFERMADLTTRVAQIEENLTTVVTLHEAKQMEFNGALQLAISKLRKDNEKLKSKIYKLEHGSNATAQVDEDKEPEQKIVSSPARLSRRGSLKYSFGPPASASVPVKSLKLNSITATGSTSSLLLPTASPSPSAINKTLDAQPVVISTPAQSSRQLTAAGPASPSPRWLRPATPRPNSTPVFQAAPPTSKATTSSCCDCLFSSRPIAPETNQRREPITVAVRSKRY